MRVSGTNERSIEALDALHTEVSGAQRRMFRAIVEADLDRAWCDSGARDMAHWLSMRYGVSWWKARRWIAAAHALEALPGLSEALATGELGVDKVVELTRFATRETEKNLIVWAKGVSPACVRRKADLACRSSIDEARDAERARTLSWWYFEENSRFGLHAELPAAQGAVIAKALERLSDELPVMPGEEDPHYVDARRADALVAMCSSRLAQDADPDRASVVVHAQLDGLLSGDHGCQIEGGPVIHPEVVRRLLCTGRVQVVLEDREGNAVRLGRLRREPSASMMRQLRYRDQECRFPGCGARRYTQAHHIVWWEQGGRTDLDNLLLVCTFHHRLVHEHGWAVCRRGDGAVDWFLPDGRRHRAGPAPPSPIAEPQPALASAHA